MLRIDPATDKQSLTFPDIKLVNVDWLLDSTKNKKRSDESSYLLTSSSGMSATPAPTSQTRTTRNKGVQDSQANGDKDNLARADLPAKKSQETSKKATGKRKRDEQPVKQEDTPEQTAIDPRNLKVPVDSVRYAHGTYFTVVCNL